MWLHLKQHNCHLRHHFLNLIHLPNYLLVIIIFYNCFINQGVLCLQYQDNNLQHYGNPPSQHPSYSTYYKIENIKHLNYRNNNNPSHPHSQEYVETQTEYGIETIQRGVAYVNPKQKNYTPVRVGPDKDQTKHYFVRINTTTHYLPGNSVTNGLLDDKATLQTPSPLPTPPPPSLSYQIQNYKQNQTYILYPHRRQHYYPQQQQQEQQYNNNNHHHHNHHHHHRRRHQRLRNSLSNSNDSGDCVKCPSEKIIIAQKGLDGVLIDPPKLFSCHNRLILNGLYQIETLFGNEFKFLLTHGQQSFHAKIRSKYNPKFEQICLLRYKVVVQQCGRYFPQNDNVRAKCYPGYIWGSKCYFTCRTGYLSHTEPMTCGDSLKWEGDEPECLSEPPQLAHHQSRITRSRSCDFIEIPENGKFSCQYPSSSSNNSDYENELATPEGTICRVVCNRNYDIPQQLLPYSVLRCEYGRWNSTANGLCQPKYHKY